MNTHVNKIQENKSHSVANAIAQKSNSNKSTFQFVDKRPETIAQRKLQEMVDNSTQVKQLRTYKTIMTTVSQPQIIQFGGSRPSFSGPARKQRRVTDSDDDLAHRISYHDIEQIVSGGSKSQIKELIEKVTIPQRKFGIYPKGYQGYFNKVKSITDQRELIKALNNSPFNLRPGVASVNRSIGAGFDPNVDDSGYDTDQSEALRPLALSHDAEDRTSSYLSDKDLGKWEDKAFGNLSI